MIKSKLHLRLFIYFALPLFILAYAHFVEPFWLKVSDLQFSDSPVCKIIHVSDLHYKGDRNSLEAIVKKINDASPNLVCFTGDIAEQQPYFDQALEVLQSLNAPLYCVPGNHDPSVGPIAERIRATCQSTGGDFLIDKEVVLTNWNLRLVGTENKALVSENPQLKTIVLCHYPDIAAGMVKKTSALGLAGHTHGGQVRLPFIGALILPLDAGRYESGLYAIRKGKLYVNQGLGTFVFRIRFLCRPEITIVLI